MDRVFDGLTFHEFSIMGASRRPDAPITKDGVVVGWRRDHDYLAPATERVFAVGKCPDIQRILDAAYAKFKAEKKAERERRDIEFAVEVGAARALKKAAARKALGLPSSTPANGGSE